MSMAGLKDGIVGFARRRLTILSMSPDSYQRHKFASGILAKEGCRTLLDVGGGDWRFFRRFLPGVESTTLDTVGGDITYDGKRIPFRDGSFDAVTAMETIQYVDDADKKRFVGELLRVAKKYVIFSTPVDEPALKAAETECNDTYKRIFGHGNEWLDKHIKNGRPNMIYMKKLLKGRDYEVHGICNLGRWKKMFKLGLVFQRLNLLLVSAVINALYVALYGADRVEPTYLKVFFIRK